MNLGSSRIRLGDTIDKEIKLLRLEMKKEVFGSCKSDIERFNLRG